MFSATVLGVEPYDAFWSVLVCGIGVVVAILVGAIASAALSRWEPWIAWAAIAVLVAVVAILARRWLAPPDARAQPSQ